MYFNQRLIVLAVLALAVGAIVVGSQTQAQVIAPSVYTTTIQVQGEEAGMEFNDWATSGITVVDMDPEDNIPTGPDDIVDIAGIQIANDDEFIYIHMTTYNPAPVSMLNLFLGFDVDQDFQTGWNIFDLFLLGSDIGYQNDFPFHQNNGGFNSGLAFTGGPIGNGGALIYPFWTEGGPPMGTEIEWAVPLEAVVQFPPGLGGPAPAFPNPSFDFVIWTDEGQSDISQVISYTLASAPNLSGDFDGNGSVGNSDLTLLLDSWGLAPAAGWVNDVPAGTVGNDSLTILLDNWGNSALSAASVPEPTALALLLLGCCNMILRRR